MMKRLLVAGLLITVAASAGPVQFSGSVGIYGDQSFISGDDSLLTPVSDLTFTVNPTVSFWEFPLSLDILISTQENNLRQQLDQFRLFLHPSEWVEGMLNAPALALAVKGVEVGTCNPSWSPLTLSGATVTGAAVEFNPWYVYLAATAGRTQRAVEVSDSTEAAYSRMLYAGKFGFGKKEATHFYLTGLYAKDDPNSLANNRLPVPGDTNPEPDSFDVVTPEENYLLGAEFNLHLAEGLFTVESEITVSERTRDNRMEVVEFDWLPDWIESTLKPRLSSSVDFAYAVRPALNFWDTELYGQVEMVGPGYSSLGAPSVRHDNLAYGGGVRRDFLDRQLSLAVAVTSERDNLMSARDSAGEVIRLKATTTHFTSWSVDLGLAFISLPYLQVSYSPYWESSDSIRTKADVISAAVGHSFQVGATSHSPGVSGSYQALRSGGEGSDYTAFDVNLNHSIGFESPLSLSAGVGYTQTAYADTTPTDRTVFMDVNPSYTLFDVWSNSLTLGGSFGSGTRFDIRLNSSVPAWSICDVSVGVEEVIYSGSDGDYNEFRLNASLSRNW